MNQRGEQGGNDNLAAGWEQSKRALLDAERFKAGIAPPKGRSGNNAHVLDVSQFIDTDDEFFNVTCHIEPNLVDRIERGEFVELERLLPPRGPHGGKLGFRQEDENRLRLIEENGEKFLTTTPAASDKGISSLRKWEQAFRVYAAVYTRANPSRAAEVWQYVHIIHTAALSWAWDNVAYYDYTFRQLMAYNPARSWAKTYTQAWNLSMCDPLGPVADPGFGQGGGQKFFLRFCRCSEAESGERSEPILARVQGLP